MKETIGRLVELCIMVIDDLEAFKSEGATEYAKTLQNIIDEI